MNIRARFDDRGDLSFMQRESDGEKQQLSNDQIDLYRYRADQIRQISDALRQGRVVLRQGRWHAMEQTVTTCEGQTIQAGHEVTVIARQPGPAEETSAANAGQISPGYAAPWAAPGVPLKAIKWMFQRHAPLAIGLDGTQFQLKWMWQMLRNCDTRHYMENKGRMVRLAEYSRDCLKALRESTGIQYEGRQQISLNKPSALPKTPSSE